MKIKEKDKIVVITGQSYRRGVVSKKHRHTIDVDYTTGGSETGIQEGRVFHCKDLKLIEAKLKQK